MPLMSLLREERVASGVGRGKKRKAARQEHRDSRGNQEKEGRRQGETGKMVGTEKETTVRGND